MRDYYNCPALSGMGGCKVTVLYLPGDLSFVGIEHEGRFLGYAELNDNVPPEEIRAAQNRRHELEQQARIRLREAKRLMAAARRAGGAFDVTPPPLASSLAGIAAKSEPRNEMQQASAADLLLLTERAAALRPNRSDRQD
jgi:hypothetical protein